ncbi:MAG TPA: ComEC/Rec2 family competence protein [Novosphingobium sp.]|nr:ComEC/Rec2 family competence protein [Novosphingobium sp.]
MWRIRRGLSSVVARGERLLESTGFDRAPWLAVGFACGIALWFDLANRWQWLALIALCIGGALAVVTLLRADGSFPFVRQSLAVLALVIAAGCMTVWAKSSLVGAVPVARPMVERLTGTVLSREEQPADARVRLVLATREPGSDRAIRVRVNLPIDKARTEIAEGAVVRLRARLMPPAPPMLPGGYDFARAAWFSGLAATGSVLGDVEVLRPGQSGGLIRAAQRSLSAHVRARLAGSPGTIAAAFASGDRGAIAEADDTAMRDAGLTHLLSVSGLHVSAVVAAAYLLAIRLLALWPWLALRVRLPLVAAGAGALAGVGYTLLTGAEVPTVRSCIGAVLVLIALALGREPLSLRMLAVGALFVMLVWPEAVVGPSFQMSFGAVLAIVALHGSAPVRAFLAPREESWWQRGGRRLAMLLLTGVVIELALMPIGLFHFHRAGVYGALANVIAIPLTTFVSMPLIALALLLDTVGAGAPAWWLAGKSLELLLALAHWTAARPGAVTLMPAMGEGAFVLFIAGGLWLALWRGRMRLLGVAPALLGVVSLAMVHPPDVLVSSDGRHVGITGLAEGTLLVLREGRSDFARENLLELAGMDGTTKAFEDWSGANCNRDFCALTIERGGRDWHVLAARGKDLVEERALAAACDRVDIVVSERWLPRSCHPRWLKVDRGLLARTGGLSFDLGAGHIRTVAQDQGEHGWWRIPEPRPKRKREFNPVATPEPKPPQ